MKDSIFRVGDRVVYARGAKGPLVGKKGTIIRVWKEWKYPFAQVDFDNGSSSPCLVTNL
jgi:hypothetical protein